MSVAEQLAAAGMSVDEARRKEDLAHRVRDALGAMQSDGDGQRFAFWVPGRIEFLGKHTDYAGGRSLVCAAERGMVIAARTRTDRRIHMCDAVSGEGAEFALATDCEAPRGHWGNYPATVARRIARNFASASTGANIAFASDLPAASGMSSSSALIVATFLALSAVNDVASTPEYRAAIHTDEELAAYIGTVENGMSFGALAGEAGVGTFGGSEDHAAILCGTPSALTQFSFCPLRSERVIPLPAKQLFVVASSGVIAEKTGAALERYNSIARLTAEALAWMRRVHHVEYPTLAAAVDDAVAHGGYVDMPEPLHARVEQFARESTMIIPRVGDALQRGDLTTIGAFADRSQHAAETLLGNQVPETVFLAGAAREHGAAAASAFGAGFGGSVWALVHQDDAGAFATRWRDAYVREFPQRASDAEFLITRAGPSARALEQF